MAISAIDLFNPQPVDPLAQILGGANNVLTNAVNQSVQLGRDGANLRATQERQLLAERERLDNLEQRRVEFLDSIFRDDRNFAEGVMRSDREFEESNRRDARDFLFKEQTDTRDYDLELQKLQSLTESREAQVELEKRKLQTEEDELKQKSSFLDTRAVDIQKSVQPPSIIERIFGGGSASLPEDDIRKGEDLRSIGIARNNPALVTRGDELISKGTAAKLARPPKPRASTATAKKVLTDDQQAADLEATIEAIDEQLKLKPLPKLEDALNTQKANALVKLNVLRKRLGKTPASPVVSPAQSYLDAVKKK